MVMRATYVLRAEHRKRSMRQLFDSQRMVCKGYGGQFSDHCQSGNEQYGAEQPRNLG